MDLEQMAREWLRASSPTYQSEDDRLTALLQRVRDKTFQEAAETPNVWCNAGKGHKVGDGICSCRGSEEVRAERRLGEEWEKAVREVDEQGEGWTVGEGETCPCCEILRRMGRKP